MAELQKPISNPYHLRFSNLVQHVLYDHFYLYIYLLFQQMVWKGSFKTCNTNILTTQTEKQLGELLQISTNQPNNILIYILKIESFSLDENSFHCILLWHFHHHSRTIFPSSFTIYHDGITKDCIHRESCRLSDRKSFF